MTLEPGRQLGTVSAEQDSLALSERQVVWVTAQLDGGDSAWVKVKTQLNLQHVDGSGPVHRRVGSLVGTLTQPFQPSRTGCTYPQADGRRLCCSASAACRLFVAATAVAIGLFSSSCDNQSATIKPQNELSVKISVRSSNKRQIMPKRRQSGVEPSWPRQPLKIDTRMSGRQVDPATSRATSTGSARRRSHLARAG